MGNGQVDFGESSSDENEHRDGERTTAEDAGYWSLWGPQGVDTLKRATSQAHEATSSKLRRLSAQIAERSIIKVDLVSPAVSPDIVKVVRSSPTLTAQLQLEFHSSGNCKTLKDESAAALSAKGVNFLDAAGFEAIPATNLNERAKWCEKRRIEFEEAAKIVVRKRKEGLMHCHVCPLCKRHIRGTKLAHIVIHFENTHWKRTKCTAPGCERRRVHNEDCWHYTKGATKFTSALCPDHRPAECACCVGKTKKNIAS